MFGCGEDTMEIGMMERDGNEEIAREVLEGDLAEMGDSRRG